MTTTNQFSLSTEAAGLFQIFNLPKTNSAYLFSDIIKVVAEDTEAVNENSFPGLLTLSGKDAPVSSDNIIDPAGLIKMLLNNTQAGKENINAGKNILTGEKYLIKEEDLTNFLKQIGLEKPSSIAASSSDIVIEINPELLAKLAKSIKSKDTGTLKNNFVELEGLENTNIKGSSLSAGNFTITEKNTEKLTIVFKKLKTEDTDLQYAAAQQVNTSNGLNHFFTFGKLPQITKDDNSEKKSGKTVPGKTDLSDEFPVLNTEPVPANESQKEIISIVASANLSEQQILLKKNYSYIPEQSPISGNPPVSVETTLPEELAVSDQSSQLKQVPLSQQPPITEQIPVFNQAPVSEQIPVSNQTVSAQIPVSNQTVSAQIPVSNQTVSEQAPVSNQAPVSEQDQVSNRGSLSEQVPLTKGVPVSNQIFTTGQIPFSKEAPGNNQTVVTEQVPISDQNPISKQFPMSGQSPVAKQFSGQVSQVKDEKVTPNDSSAFIKTQFSKESPVVEKKTDAFISADPNVTLKVNVKNNTAISPDLNIKTTKNETVFANPAKTASPFIIAEGNPEIDSNKQVTPDVNTTLKNETSQVVGKLSKYNATFSKSTGNIQSGIKPVIENIKVSAMPEDKIEKVDDKSSQVELKNPLTQKASESELKTKTNDLPDTTQTSAKITGTEKKPGTVISPEIKTTKQKTDVPVERILQKEPVVNNSESKKTFFNDKKLFKDNILPDSPPEAIYAGVKAGKVIKNIVNTGEKNLYEVIINKTVDDSAKEQTRTPFGNKDVQVAGDKTLPQDFSAQDYDNFKREAFSLKRNIVRDQKIKEPVENVINKGDNNKPVEKTDESQKNNITVTSSIPDPVKKPPVEITADPKIQNEKPGNTDNIKVQGNKDTTSENKPGNDNNSKDTSNNTADHKPFNSPAHTDAQERFSMPKTSFNEVSSVDKQKNIESTFSTELRNIKTSELVDEVNKIVLKSEKANVTLHLNPEHLGKVKVIVDIANSMVSTKIEVENESVKQFVQTNIDQLKDSLQQNGVHISSFTISLSAGEQKSAGKFKHKNGDKTDNTKNNIETDDELDLSNTKRMGYNTYEYLA